QRVESWTSSRCSPPMRIPSKGSGLIFPKQRMGCEDRLDVPGTFPRRPPIRTLSTPLPAKAKSIHWEEACDVFRPCFDFTIRETISETANHRSRGLVMVYSVPLNIFTARLIESFHGTACGFRL